MNLIVIVHQKIYQPIPVESRFNDNSNQLFLIRFQFCQNDIRLIRQSLLVNPPILLIAYTEIIVA